MLSLIILLPLLGFVLNAALHFYARRKAIQTLHWISGILGTVVMVGAFIASLVQFYRLQQLPESGMLFEEFLFQWIHIGALIVDFTLRFDALSSIFCLIITGVGSLIHLYSIGYMSEDKGVAKYFAYLNLFCFMMLNLVLGSTLPHVFLGWEGVGLASYLLIGFWFQDNQKVAAGQKAFIMNRIGDVAFLLAMFIGFQHTGTLDLLGLNASMWFGTAATAFGLLIFFACTGKSAQIPLFTWLPDAMAGPTPVSALIHAATMVTSGIYLLARLSPIILQSETVLLWIAMVGAATAFLSALMACAQTDIKKVLAYSTVSQLGFMFLACGVGAFDYAVFHVMTHAFFKALLFLGAGSVIHALAGEQNIFKMGALRKRLPITSVTFILGWAAILGLPPFSGFFSKDGIIHQAWVSPYGGNVLLVVAVASAFLTAFYMTRLLVLVFFSQNRVDPAVDQKIHESPPVMTVPLMVLGLLSVVGGWFWAPGSHDTQAILVAILSVVLALLAAGFAYYRYRNLSSEQENRFLLRGMEFDRAYDLVFVRGVRSASQSLVAYLEQSVIQRLIRWSGAVVSISGSFLRVLHVGSAQVYLMMILIALFSVLAWFFFGVGQYGKF